MSLIVVPAANPNTWVCTAADAALVHTSLLLMLIEGACAELTVRSTVVVPTVLLDEDTVELAVELTVELTVELVTVSVANAPDTQEITTPSHMYFIFMLCDFYAFFCLPEVANAIATACF